MTIRTIACLLAVMAWQQVSLAQSYRKQDAGVGGLAGAVIGGIIGHQNDETAEGALIGGAVGAIAGGILGDNKDQQVYRRRYYQQQVRQQAQHQAWHRQQVSRAVSINDVVSMSQSGLSDAVILNHIQTNGVAGQVGTHEIIAMHNRGVTENVITAMQRANQAGSISRPETVIVEHEPPTSVVVRKEVRVVPRPVYVPHHHPRHVPHSRVRYATRPAFPTFPSRAGFYRHW